MFRLNFFIQSRNVQSRYRQFLTFKIYSYKVFKTIVAHIRYFSMESVQFLILLSSNLHDSILSFYLVWPIDFLNKPIAFTFCTLS